MSDSDINLEEVFNQALACTSKEDRQLLLDKLCIRHPNAKQRIEALLRAHERVGNFLGGEDLTADDSDESGTRVGNYTLEQKIGEGGMGAVYAAIQHEPVRRRVALKIIKRGMDSHEVLKRFEAERQALAQMDHPSIARVLDAGQTERGQPYFVMELVEGAPITRFCDSQKLSLYDRLKLFVPICHAVQHAHQKGIIHRDLKPSNILVTQFDDQPIPKVIDFGVAKATKATPTDASLAETQLGQIIGTLQYMSPEQAGANPSDVDTRADVYSLGALLYELLTGSTPIESNTLEKQALDRILTLIREIEPDRPSARLTAAGDKITTISEQRQLDPRRLSQILQGDLDWIVMKALEKDRVRRYSTASDFAQDIQRFLSGDTVEARPPSARYRMQKLVSRHRGLVAAVLAITSLLLVTSSVSTWFGFTAVQASKAAELSADDATREKNKAQAETLRATNAERLARAEALRANAATQSALQREREVTRYKEAYLSQAASALMEIGQSRQARYLLSQLQQRGASAESWEEAYLKRRLDEAAMVFQWQLGSITAMVLGPNGQLAIGDSHGFLRIIDVSSGEISTTYAAHRGAVRSVAFLDDGAKLATAGADGLVKTWTNKGSLQLTLSLHFLELYDAAFVPERSLVISAGPTGIVVADLEDGKQLFSEQLNDVVTRVTTDSAGRWLLGASKRGNLLLWDLPASSTDWKLDTPTIIEERESTSGRAPNELTFATNSDDTQLVTSTDGKLLRVWDLTTRTLISEFEVPLEAQVRCLAFDQNDQSILVGGSDAALTVLNNLRRPQSRLQGHAGPITQIACSAGGIIATVDNTGELRIWKPAQPRLQRDVQTHLLNVVDLAYSADGSRLVSASYDLEGGLTDTKTGTVIRKFGKHVANFSPSLNGRPKSIRSIDTLEGHTNILTCCDITTDGQIVATGGMDNTARLWNTVSGEAVAVLQHPSAVTSIQFDRPSGNRLATACWDDYIRLWDTLTHAETLRFKASDTAHTNVLAFAPSGDILVTGMDDGTVAIWDTATGQRLQMLDAHEKSVRSVAFDLSGKRFVSSGYDRAIRLWEQSQDQQWHLEREFFGHTGAVQTVGFDPAGDRIVSASRGNGDDSVRLWDVNIGLETLKLDGNTAAMFSPDGTQLAMVGNGRSGLVRILDVSNRFEEIDPILVASQENTLPEAADLRLLGSFGSNRIEGRNASYEADPQHTFVGIVLSLTNRRLMLSRPNFEQWRQGQLAAGKTPIDNPNRLKLVSKDDFALVFEDQELSAVIISPTWPQTDYVTQNISHTRTVDFVPEERQAMVVIWEVPAGFPSDGLSVRFRRDEPVQVPNTVIPPPASSPIHSRQP